jgi:3'5'-cyclic nucleotide phosphodiesterase
MSAPEASEPNLSPAALAETGLELISADWTTLGFGTSEHTCESGDVAVLQHRITALLVARCAAVVVSPVVSPATTANENGGDAVEAPSVPREEQHSYKDYSTRSICKTAIRKGWPPAITTAVIAELAEFVKRMLMGYKDVPYHNRKHCYHVVLSTTKLIDMMIASGSRTYGLKYDPLALLALVFAALSHDVEHQGIPNRQLAAEDDRLAVLYNDQSMAENWSLYVAFSELLQEEFTQLRSCIFCHDTETNQHEYRRFRKLVVNLVLCTDIASPERTQIGKSKWKEAFGDPFETVERKIREERRLSMTGRLIVRRDRRGSAISAISQQHPSDLQNIDDDSLSATPEHSETEDGGEAQNNGTHRIKEAMVANKTKLERRMSAASVQSSKYRQRLGILRTVDLSGETLETYERRGSLHTSSGLSHASSTEHTGINGNLSVLAVMDEADDLKAAVIMENIIQAADVGHNLQGWDHMVRKPRLVEKGRERRPHTNFNVCRSSGPVACTWNFAGLTWPTAALIRKKNGLKIKLAFWNRTCCRWRDVWKIPVCLVRTRVKCLQ